MYKIYKIDSKFVGSQNKNDQIKIFLVIATGLAPTAALTMDPSRLAIDYVIIKHDGTGFKLESEIYKNVKLLMFYKGGFLEYSPENWKEAETAYNKLLQFYYPGHEVVTFASNSNFFAVTAYRIAREHKISAYRTDEIDKLMKMYGSDIISNISEKFPLNQCMIYQTTGPLRVSLFQDLNYVYNYDSGYKMVFLNAKE